MPENEKRFITIYGRGLTSDQRKEVPPGVDPIEFAVGLTIGEVQNLREEFTDKFESVKEVAENNRSMIGTVAEAGNDLAECHDALQTQVMELENKITNSKTSQKSFAAGKLALTKDIGMVITMFTAIVTLIGKAIGWW